MSRVLTVSLVLAQVLTAIPSLASAAPVSSATVPAPTSTPPQVKVNRTVPAVTPPPTEPQFSASPTVQEIFRARVFTEPLVPIGGEPTAGENLVLAQALLAFHRSRGIAWESTLAPFLVAHPASPWRPSLLANLGTVQLRAHAYSRALASWNEAWTLAKDVSDPKGRAVADGALAEWLTLAASMGQIEAAQARLVEVGQRPITGSASAKITAAREAIALISRHPEKTIPCGPEALLALLASEHRPEPRSLTAYVPTVGGTSLSELANLATRAGLPLQPAYRESAMDVPVPAVVHLKVGHYIAITEHVGDRYRVVDRSLVESYWISRDTLLDESSGYVLITRGGMPMGWHAVSESEGATITGRGPLCPDGAPPPPPSPGCDCLKGNCCGQKGMADYRLDDLTASLLLSDQPLTYTPPRGPAMPMALVYYHRESLQPQIFTFSNLGSKWTFGWTRFVQEVPTDIFGITPPHVSVSLPPSREVFSAPDAQGVYPAHWNSRSVLVHVSDSPVRYERRMPDGAVEAYTLSDGAPAGQRRIMLTQITDPQGQSVQLTWDSQTRLVAITDAIGQVTTFAYELAVDPLKITKITDPFGRFATFTYNAAGQLASITDVIGLTSRFAYGPEDFVNSLTTPYGVTTFRHEPNAANTLNVRYIEATDPLGATEHMEFQWETPTLPASLAASDVPWA